MSLNNKVAVITGASSGVGAELAQILAREGATTIICARRSAMLSAIAEKIRIAGGQAIPIVADITRREEAESVVKSAISRYGKIDILVNNAGRGNYASIEDTTNEQLENIFAVNTFALWYTTAAALPSMKARKSGHIITISSVVGTMGYPFNSAYVASKHAAVGFHAALRTELIETGIRATLICPDAIATDWSIVTEGGSYGELFSDALKRSREIARERNIPLAPLARLQSAASVAAEILKAILNPNSDADIYTHPGTRDRAIAVAHHRENVELSMLPIFLGMQQEYESRKCRNEK